MGAGIFGVPYVFAKAGFGLGVFCLFVLGFFTLVLNLAFGEIVLRTKEHHELVGYAQKYLGRDGKALGWIALALGLYGALLAYIIQVGNFLGLILGKPQQGFYYSLVFFLIGILVVWLGLRLIAELELILVLGILVLITLIALFGFPSFSFSNFPASLAGGQFLTSGLTVFRSSKISTLFLPYGVLLFALAGSSIIPEMAQLLKNEPKKLQSAIIFGTSIPALVYFLFAAVIVGISGVSTSTDAIAGLLGLVNPALLKMGAILGVLTMSTSFLTLGFVLREMWQRDFGVQKELAWFLAIYPPLLLFLLGNLTFIKVLELTGGITVGLTGILLMIIYAKARKHSELKPAYALRLPRALRLLISLVFALGILYQLVQALF